MKKRKYLKNRITLCGESDGEIFKRTFTIVKRISEGASTVCYEAYHSASGRGILKEFYPKATYCYALERDKSGQIVLQSEFRAACEKYLENEREYVEPYNMLLELKKNGKNKDIATFIPAFEIYHGCDSSGKPNETVYIWTPNPELLTFDKVCDNIHKHPHVKPEHKLVTILCAIDTLTKCVCELHKAGMIHRDIKPSNFGFVKRNDEALTQTLSMFDVNSLCSVYRNSDDVIGTREFMEPEAGYMKANNKTDLYSIGATLFYAIIITEDTKKAGYIYREEYFDRLREMVDSSELINASESNSHPRLKNVLTKILRSCLCERIERYSNCEELLEDIELALYYSLPAEISKKRKLGERWLLADVEKTLDKNNEKNSSLAIQYHLYDNPLYKGLTDKDKEMNVVVFGFGNYGQKFLDACLQAGQFIGKKLNVSVVSNSEFDSDISDRELYLLARPELDRFFDIDNSLGGSDDAYGKISTFQAKLIQNEKIDEAVLCSLIKKLNFDTSYQYVFVALGDDDINLSFAKKLKKLVAEKRNDCDIHYICENTSTKSCPGLYQVCVNEDARKNPRYSEIERMALNTHFVWNKDINVDTKIIRREFQKKYNHDSCVSSVLSIKYKLYSIGVDLNSCDANEAARIYSKIVLGENSEFSDIKNQLICIEHRRWVTEKLCQGWRRIENLEDCLGGVTKDEKLKKHVCILHSRPDRRLTELFGSGEKWDYISDYDLNELDELDQMSVRLHRIYAEKAEEIKKRNLLSGNSISGIRGLINTDKSANTAFMEWYGCLKDIWSGDTAKVHLYRSLKKAFLDATENLPEDRKKSVFEQVKAFENIFYPILASMEYRDWKQDDVAIIDNIPFILTYSEKTCLVVPFAVGNSSAVFKNVAAASVINPEQIIYIGIAENRDDAENMEQAIPYILDYLRRKQLQSKVEFIVACDGEMDSSAAEELENRLAEFKCASLKSISVKAFPDRNSMLTSLRAFLEKRNTGKKLLAVERNETQIYELMDESGLFDSFNSYKFDSVNAEFSMLSGCDLFGYITKKPHITIADMALNEQISEDSNTRPEFYDDYQNLWAKYCDGVNEWKQLSKVLHEYNGKNGIIATFPWGAGRNDCSERNEFRYILPFVCGKSVVKIINYLLDYETICLGSKVRGYTTDSCEAIIVAPNGLKAELDRMFSNVYALMNADKVTLHVDELENAVNVHFDSLIVSDLELPASEKEKLNDLLSYFNSKSFVCNLTEDENSKIGFTYATEQTKHLMLSPGKMIEVYIFHGAKSLGCFDDVVCGVTTGQTSDEDGNALCVITKGFKTLLVRELPATKKERECYCELAKQYAVNATMVFVDDTQQRIIIPEQNAVVIDKPCEVNDIGSVLLDIINDKYVYVS